MNIITDVYLVLKGANKYAKVLSQDITEDFDKRIAGTRLVYSANGFKEVCYDVANEFRVKWEDANNLDERTLARTRIRVD